MPVVINGSTGISGVDGSAGTPSYQGGDTNTGIFYPAADTIAFAEGGVEIARFDSSGNLGIGTTSPSFGLTVQRDNGSGYVAGFRSAAGSPMLTIQNTGGVSQIQGLNSALSATADIALQVSGGNVGIGTSSPNERLMVAGAIRATSNAANFAASDGALIDYFSGDMRIVAARSGANSSNMTFTTYSSGTANERMRITSGGQVGIGQNPTSYAQLQILFDATTAANNSLGIGISPVANTSNANFLQFYNATGNSCGNVTRNGTSNAVLYNTSSDYRLKENINPMTGALAKVQLLKPVTWTWIEGKQAGEGFIAHELQEVIPFAVTGQKDEMQTYVDSEGVEKTRPKYQGLDASYLVATLTAAIQEQQAMIEELKAKVAALEAK